MGDVRTTLTLPSKLCHTMGGQVGSRGCGYRTQKSQGGAEALGKHLRCTLSSEPCRGCQAPGALPVDNAMVSLPLHSLLLTGLARVGGEGFTPLLFPLAPTGPGGTPRTPPLFLPSPHRHGQC